MTTTASTTTTMAAITQHGYGGIEQLRIDRMPVPAPAADQVLVRVHAVSPDSGTIHILTADPRLVRLAFGWRRPRQPIIGLAFAGEVVAVGEQVVGVAVGDRVAGSAPAAFAEHVVASPTRIARIPDAVSMTDAATLAISGTTALQAVRDAARVQAGQSVLVIGAGGGVGAFLVQLAVAAGARVTGVASAAKAELVRSLGAVDVIDYRTTPGPEGWGRFDVIIDTADGRALHVLRRALTERGTLVIVGADSSGGPLLRGADRQLRAVLQNPWVRHRLTAVVNRENGEDVAVLLGMVAQGTVRAPIDEIASLDAALPLIERLQRQQVAGKAVIRVVAETDQPSSVTPRSEPDTGPSGS